MTRIKEIVIFVAVLCVLLAAVIFISLNKQNGKTVEITENGKAQSFSLNENRTVDLKNNTVVIENGEVWVSHAVCPNQICVNTGKISAVGEQIACIPNKVLVEIKK